MYYNIEYRNYSYYKITVAFNSYDTTQNLLYTNSCIYD